MATNNLDGDGESSKEIKFIELVTLGSSQDDDQTASPFSTCKLPSKPGPAEDHYEESQDKEGDGISDNVYDAPPKETNCTDENFYSTPKIKSAGIHNSKSCVRRRLLFSPNRQWNFVDSKMMSTNGLNSLPISQFPGISLNQNGDLPLFTEAGSATLPSECQKMLDDLVRDVKNACMVSPSTDLVSGGKY